MVRDHQRALRYWGQGIKWLTLQLHALKNPLTSCKESIATQESVPHNLELPGLLIVQFSNPPPLGALIAFLRSSRMRSSFS